jgi:hypothetical protein
MREDGVGKAVVRCVRARSDPCSPQPHWRTKELDHFYANAPRSELRSVLTLAARGQTSNNCSYINN